MKAPKHLDLTHEQVEQLVDRVDNDNLRQEDYLPLINILQTAHWLCVSLKDTELTIEHLQELFGAKIEPTVNLDKCEEEKNPQ